MISSILPLLSSQVADDGDGRATRVDDVPFSRVFRAAIETRGSESGRGDHTAEHEASNVPHDESEAATVTMRWMTGGAPMRGSTQSGELSSERKMLEDMPAIAAMMKTSDDQEKALVATPPSTSHATPRAEKGTGHDTDLARLAEERQMSDGNLTSYALAIDGVDTESDDITLEHAVRELLRAQDASAPLRIVENHANASLTLLRVEIEPTGRAAARAASTELPPDSQMANDEATPTRLSTTTHQGTLTVDESTPSVATTNGIKASPREHTEAAEPAAAEHKPSALQRADGGTQTTWPNPVATSTVDNEAISSHRIAPDVQHETERPGREQPRHAAPNDSPVEKHTSTQVTSVAGATLDGGHFGPLVSTHQRPAPLPLTSTLPHGANSQKNQTGSSSGSASTPRVTENARARSTQRGLLVRDGTVVDRHRGQVPRVASEGGLANEEAPSEVVSEIPHQESEARKDIADRSQQHVRGPHAQIGEPNDVRPVGSLDTPSIEIDAPHATFGLNLTGHNRNKAEARQAIDQESSTTPTLRAFSTENPVGDMAPAPIAGEYDAIRRSLQVWRNDNFVATRTVDAGNSRPAPEHVLDTREHNGIDAAQYTRSVLAALSHEHSGEQDRDVRHVHVVSEKPVERVARILNRSSRAVLETPRDASTARTSSEQEPAPVSQSVDTNRVDSRVMFRPQSHSHAESPTRARGIELAKAQTNTVAKADEPPLDFAPTGETATHDGGEVRTSPMHAPRTVDGAPPRNDSSQSPIDASREARFQPRTEPLGESLAGRRSDSASIRIEDPDGNSTFVRVTVRGDHVRTNIVHPDRHVAGQLANGADQLRDALNARGFQDAAVSIQSPRGAVESSLAQPNGEQPQGETREHREGRSSEREHRQDRRDDARDSRQERHHPDRRHRSRRDRD